MSETAFVAYVLDQLRGGPAATARPMFGGHGFYARGSCFAIAWKSRLFFKVSEGTRAEFERMGSEPFRPGPRQVMKGYYEVPSRVLEDGRELRAWAARAIGAADGRPPAPSVVPTVKKAARPKVTIVRGATATTRVAVAAKKARAASVPPRGATTSRARAGSARSTTSPARRSR